MIYLIQTINGKVEHEFSLSLIESIKYLDWVDGSIEYGLVYSDKPNIPGCVPIGSIEFVREYLKTHHNLTPKPRNIPITLLGEEYTLRSVKNGTHLDVVDTSFVKANDTFKGYTEITDNPPPGLYQISEVVEIDSEWRSFIYKGVLVGLQNYSGDFTSFPDVDRIQSMIDAFTDAPVAYTLDVGVHKDRGTFIIEVHDFFSCGLYGFSDSRILPHMYSRWFNEYTQKH